MDSEASSFGAANLRHHRYMVFGKKQRYIEVFQCSGEDMSLVLTGGAQQQKPPLLSPGMLDAQGAAPPPLPDPLVQCAPPLPAHLLNLPPPQLLPQQALLPGLLPQQQMQLPPPNMQQHHLALLQQLQMQGQLQQQQVLMQQGLLGAQPQQMVMFPPRLAPPTSLATFPPRFLLPQPLPLPQQLLPQPGAKRSHEQAFLAQAPGLPPKRPPVMYGTPPLDPGTPPPQPALLPTPPSLPSYPV